VLLPRWAPLFAYSERASRTGLRLRRRLVPARERALCCFRGSRCFARRGSNVQRWRLGVVGNRIVRRFVGPGSSSRKRAPWPSAVSTCFPWP
jgi:hypothetical protein